MSSAKKSEEFLKKLRKLVDKFIDLRVERDELMSNCKTAVSELRELLNKISMILDNSNDGN